MSDEKDLLAKFRTQGQDISEMQLAQKAAQLTPAFQGRLPLPQELKNINEELGVEMATAVFLRALQESNVHGPMNREIRKFDLSTLNREAVRKSQIEVTVVASNLFYSGRKWGDHVEEWRTWARDLGFTTDIIDTDPRRSVAANARAIFEHLARSPERTRIIVTYGQGASEFRYLLHRRVNRDPNDPLPEELAHIRAWVNVAGSFAGSALSRYYQADRLKQTLMKLRMKVSGRTPIALAETSTFFPLWRRPLPLPPNLLITSLVGVPYRVQVPQRLSGTYQILSKTLPNDGAVTVLEASGHPGYIVAVPGMSHAAETYLLEPMFKRTLAMIAQSIGLNDEAVTAPEVKPELKPESKRLEEEIRVIDLEDEIDTSALSLEDEFSKR